MPDIGDAIINGTSVVRHPRTARSALGVCPQFTAIDSQLTVREHLFIYGRLKGLKLGAELDESIESVIQGTSLSIYADRLASKLSGGNQRKLSLAISLIGNPSVILIDEFSTGIDPKMKRDMWQTLRTVAVGKAVIVTTRQLLSFFSSVAPLTLEFQIQWRKLLLWQVALVYWQSACLVCFLFCFCFLLVVD